VTPIDKIQAVQQVLAVNLLNPTSILASAGMYALWIVIFAETGLLIGFFLPGDTILFLAGIASSPVVVNGLHKNLPIVPLLVVTPIFAIAGAQLGHHLGVRYGIRLFNRPNARIFRHEYVDKSETYFVRFGPAKAIVLARFVPIVRTFLNPICGILGVSARRFLVWNIVGAVIWTESVLLAGHFLAKPITKVIPADKLDYYLVPVIVGVVIIAAIPMLVDIVRKRREDKRTPVASGDRPGD
jgi:membrane-associated protein